MTWTWTMSPWLWAFINKWHPSQLKWRGYQLKLLNSLFNQFKSDYLPLCLVLKFVMLAALNWHRCTLCSGTRGHQSSQVKSSQVNWGERQIGAESCFCLLSFAQKLKDEEMSSLLQPNNIFSFSISPHCGQSKRSRSKNMKMPAYVRPCLRIFATNRKSLQRKL